MEAPQMRSIGSWPVRSEVSVLAVEAHSMGALAVIRSLGRAGYRVHACSPQNGALGLRSSYTTVQVTPPSYDEKGFCDWLARYVAANDIKVIIPSEAFLIAIRARFEELSPLLPVSPDRRITYRGLSKVDVALAFETGDATVRRRLPPQRIIMADTPLQASDFAALRYPIFAKVDAIHACAHGDGRVIRINDPSSALSTLQELQQQYEKILVQEFVPGQGVGAFFLLWDGEILGEFMHRRLHEVPHTGGISSLRESYFSQEIRDDALARLRHLEWRGVAMLEYRLDPVSGQFHFIELNGRFWGSLHLALYSGIDFPTLLVDIFCGMPVEPQTSFRTGIRCRSTFPGELQHVWSKLKDPTLSWLKKSAAISEFFLLSLDPTVRSDLLFPGDRMLYLEGVKRAFRRSVKT